MEEWWLAPILFSCDPILGGESRDILHCQANSMDIDTFR